MKANKQMAAAAKAKAAVEYARLTGEVARKLAEIESGLKAHAARQSADPANFGYVGDLAALNAELNHLADRLHRRGEYAA